MQDAFVVLCICVTALLVVSKLLPSHLRKLIPGVPFLDVREGVGEDGGAAEAERQGARRSAPSIHRQGGVGSLLREYNAIQRKAQAKGARPSSRKQAQRWWRQRWRRRRQQQQCCEAEDITSLPQASARRGEKWGECCARCNEEGNLNRSSQVEKLQKLWARRKEAHRHEPRRHSQSSKRGCEFHEAYRQGGRRHGRKSLGAKRRRNTRKHASEEDGSSSSSAKVLPYSAAGFMQARGRRLGWR